MITLIPSQLPQQDLGMIAQVLMGQGFVQQPASERAKDSHAIVFYTQDKTNTVTIKFYQEVGTLRIETIGDIANKLAGALAQYMEAMTIDSLTSLFDEAQSDVERRVYALLLVLAYPDAMSAYTAMREKYLVNGNNATREGMVQGFAILETPDVGQVLEAIEAEFKGQDIATLCRRDIDALSERGLIRESLGSFIAKIRALIPDNSQEALSLIEKYCDGNPDADALRALKCRALIAMGKTAEAENLLANISLNDPDAPEAFIERAKLRETNHFIDQALKDIQCALACTPSDEEAQLVYKRLSMLANQREASDEEKLTQYTQALDAAPDDANLLCQRAQSLLNLGEYEKARADALHARKVSPNDPRLPALLCETYLAMGWLGSALEQASIAQKVFLPTQRVHASFLKVRVFLALNRIESARHALRELPQDLQTEPEYALYQGIIAELLQTDDADAAYACLDKTRADAILRHDKPRFYHDVPRLRHLLPDAVPPIHAPLDKPLDQEPTDPYFKRCDACGALTMARRTFCKECSNASFF